MWCAHGPQTQGMKRGRECQFSAKLDMMTLVATRGRNFPISWLGTRLKCPRCGSTSIRILWDFPSQPKPNAAAALSVDAAKADALIRKLRDGTSD